MRSHIPGFSGYVLFLLVASACLAAPPDPICYHWEDSTPYFIPSYSGWQTAKLIFQGSDGSVTYLRKLSYGANKFELIKFDNPYSSETYAYDGNWIYITAENMQNNTPETRVWQAGYNGYYLGANWMPRIVCTSGNQTYKNLNRFFSCSAGTAHYTNCNSCPCQYVSTDPGRCSKYQSTVSYSNYNYGGTIGTLPTLIMQSPFDDLSGSEWYYYGLGRGFLRFEVHDSSGLVIVSYGYQSGEIPNDPIPDQACFHP
jgi:hypothetical protein